MKLDQYYLDLEKVNKLSSKEDKEQIHRYYLDMLHSSLDGREIISNSLFKTLLNGGYLVDSRDEKIDQIING
jgi:hypothetical protein